MSRFSAVTAMVLGVVFVVLVLGKWFVADDLGSAPNVEFTFSDGTTAQLGEFYGQPVLVSFWATSCAVCVGEIAELIELYDALHPDGLEIIAVAMPYDPPNRVLAMIEEKKIPYPVAIDVTGNTVLAFGNVAITPTSFLITADHAIAQKIVGAINAPKLHDVIRSMLVEKTR